MRPPFPSSHAHPTTHCADRVLHTHMRGVVYSPVTGICVVQAPYSVPVGVCQCHNPLRFGGQNCTTEVFSAGRYAMMLGFLTGTNVAMLPAGVTAVMRGMWLEATALFGNALISGMYHSCDEDAECFSVSPWLWHVRAYHPMTSPLTSHATSHTCSCFQVSSCALTSMGQSHAFSAGGRAAKRCHEIYYFYSPFMCGRTNQCVHRRLTSQHPSPPSPSSGYTSFTPLSPSATPPYLSSTHLAWLT